MNGVEEAVEQVGWREVGVGLHAADQALLTKFLAAGISRFGEPVAVDDKRIARFELNVS